MRTWAELRRDKLPACTYCGEPADTQDHVIPTSVLKSKKTVPACQNCNGILHNRLVLTVPARAAYVAERLQKFVTGNRLDRTLLQQRIAWAKYVAGA